MQFEWVSHLQMFWFQVLSSLLWSSWVALFRSRRSLWWYRNNLWSIQGKLTKYKQRRLSTTWHLALQVQQFWYWDVVQIERCTEEKPKRDIGYVFTSVIPVLHRVWHTHHTWVEWRNLWVEGMKLPEDCLDWLEPLHNYYEGIVVTWNVITIIIFVFSCVYKMFSISMNHRINISDSSPTEYSGLIGCRIYSNCILCTTLHNRNSTCWICKVESFTKVSFICFGQSSKSSLTNFLGYFIGSSMPQRYNMYRFWLIRKVGNVVWESSHHLQSRWLTRFQLPRGLEI